MRNHHLGKFQFSQSENHEFEARLSHHLDYVEKLTFKLVFYC